MFSAFFMLQIHACILRDHAHCAVVRETMPLKVEPQSKKTLGNNIIVKCRYNRFSVGFGQWGAMEIDYPESVLTY